MVLADNGTVHVAMSENSLEGCKDEFTSGLERGIWEHLQSYATKG